ncbi:HEAT repeat domain-containing protein [Moorena sp. SIO3A5]|nr:HEAT repeat domain-containing protein [Moorena sp. SIO3A5]NEP67303.1 NACHT domain-containing protein [Moorena sp. SIO3A5]
MLDWLAIWGISSAGGYLAKEVIGPLAKEALEDYTKDFFKESIKDYTGLSDQNIQKKLLGKALKEFVALVEEELEDADLSKQDVKQYTKPLKQYIKDKSIKAILGSAFKYGCKRIDTEKLAQTWIELNLLELPEGFDWHYIGKQYVKEVRTIIRESDDLRPIRDSQTLEAIAENTKPGIIPDFDLREYQEALLESYGNVKLDSLDTSGCAYNELKLWKIFIPQNVREVHDLMPEAIHELPKDDSQKLRESGQLQREIDKDELKRAKERYYQQPIKSVLDVIEDSQSYRYLVVLGDPGSGKSTLLQYLALEWAKTDLTTDSSLSIPLLIELRTYIRNCDSGQCNNFLEFCHQSSGAICHLNQHHLDQELKDGKVLVMFDGLDEVFDPEKRIDVITEIHRFTNRYPKVRVIVTSRVIGYKPQRLRDAEFRHVMLQDLESEQIQNFIEKWHKLNFTDQADKVRKQDRLQKAIETSYRIRELAQNPLLLTMMAILNRNQDLPRDRSELYNQSSRLLLHQWDVERALQEDHRVDPKIIDDEYKQHILRKVAYFMQGNQAGLAGNLISGEDLERIIKEELKLRDVNDPRAVAKVMINQLRTRNFILCFMGADYYAFVHRTFLEYFCAWEFVRKFEKTQDISLEHLKKQVFGQHWRDEYWHEVLKLIVGMIDSKKAGEIIEYLMAQDGEADEFDNLFLAAGCLSEVRNRYQIKSTDSELLNRFKDLIHDTIKYDYQKYLFDPDLIYGISIPAVVAVATHWQDHPDTLRLLQELARCDTDWLVRCKAIVKLAQGWQDNRDTLRLLQESARCDQHWYVRLTAIEQLAQGWHDREAWPTANQPWLWEFLCDRTLHDPYDANEEDKKLGLILRIKGNPRQVALNAILEYYPNHPDTLALLKKLARSDNDWKVRRTAICQLAKGYQDHPDTLPLLKKLARSDNDWKVRATAIEQLAKGYKDHPDTLPLLKKLARSDKDSSVRVTAIEQLAQGYKDHRDTLALLQKWARSDNDSSVRFTAIKQLAQGYKNHRDTLPLLQESARSDSDSWVRGKAIEQLAQGYQDHPDTLAILQESARSDTDSDVRGEAIEQLAKGYQDHPDTLAILQESARSDSDSDVRGTAIKQLAKGYQDDPDTLPLLQQSARSDTDSDVRGKAIQQLAQGYQDHPDTLPLLQEYARSDKDSDVRVTAIKQLAEGYKDHQDTLPLLQESARSDKDSDVRVTAIEQLAEGYQDHPDTLPILQESARSDTDSDVRGKAIQQLAQAWHDQPWLSQFLCDRTLHDPFDPDKDRDYERDDENYNPRQIALQAILKYYPNHSQSRSLLQDRAKHDPDPKLRKFAQKNLE